VAVRGGAGGVEFADTFELAPGASVDAPDVVPTAGEYTVTAATAESSTSTEWSTCPPSGPFAVVVRDGGRVVGDADPR
jgi:D-tyrosyl-tRNA(Tyr) deacylase